MKKILSFLFFSLLSGTVFSAETEQYDHVFFDNSLMTGSYYYSAVEYTAPSFVQNVNHRLPVSTNECFTAKNSLKLNFVNGKDGRWETTVIYPEWRGKNFIKHGDYLDFWVLGDATSKMRDLPLVAIGTAKEKSTFVEAATYVKDEAKQGWRLVHIPLTAFTGCNYAATSDLKKVYFAQSSQDGASHCYYVDQIEITTPTEVKAPVSPAITVTPYERHCMVMWDTTGLGDAKYVKIYRSSDGILYNNVGIQDPRVGIYCDFSNLPNTKFSYYVTCVDGNYNESAPSKEVQATTYMMTDNQLLNMVQEASFRYCWNGGEPISGMALENTPGRHHMVATGASGFAMMTIIAGVERGFITRAEAVARFKKIVTFLSKAERFHGAYPHFIDATTGKVEPFFGHRDNGADLVETSFLFEGLLTARNYFTQNTADEKFIRDGITKLWKGVEWSWFKQTKDSPYLYWHWSPDQGWVINHRLIGWNETMITYLLAIASPTHGVSPEMYYSGWASQAPYAKEYREGWGETSDGSSYTNGNTYYGIKLDVGVNRGGPLFFTHFSFVGNDPRGLKDKYTTDDYYTTLKNITTINYRYCLENPNHRMGYGPECWGLNVCENPWGSYGAYEATEKHEDGTMCPSGALGAFPYLPNEAMTALKNYYRNYGSFLWGEYGFRDAFNLQENWCGMIYMGLNQGVIPAMIENYRSGLIWKLFTSDPDIKRMRQRVFEK